MQEPSITINGKQLSEGQAMAIRVAIESFALDMDTNGLGEDDHGEKMTQAYLSRIREIRELMKSEHGQIPGTT